MKSYRRKGVDLNGTYLTLTNYWPHKTPLSSTARMPVRVGARVGVTDDSCTF